MKKRILVVDGMALLFRGFFATSFRGYFMENKDGVPTNGVYQFLRYFLDAVNEFEPSHVICCWDMGSKTFRTEKYDQYKANRDAPPEELIPQFELVKEIVSLFNIPNIGVQNYEADDCIGTLTKKLSLDHEVVVLTGDLDILQLVEPNVEVAIMRKGIGNYEVFKTDNFIEKVGLRPDQIVDLKGLMGDSSDNYPGVRGIGEKTATKLLLEYDNIEEILLNVDKLTKGVRTKLNEDIDMLHLSRKLAEIYCEVPLEYDLDEAIWSYNKEHLAEQFINISMDHFVKTLT